MTREDLDFIQGATETLKKVQEEFGENTSLGTIIRSYQSRMKHAMIQ